MKSNEQKPVEIKDIYDAALKLLEAHKNLESALMRKPEKGNIVLSVPEALSLLNQTGTAAFDATTVMRRIVEERAAANNERVPDFPLQDFHLN